MQREVVLLWFIVTFIIKLYSSHVICLPFEWSSTVSLEDTCLDSDSTTMRLHIRNSIHVEYAVSIFFFVLRLKKKSNLSFDEVFRELMKTFWESSYLFQFIFCILLIWQEQAWITCSVEFCLACIAEDYLRTIYYKD